MRRQLVGSHTLMLFAISALLMEVYSSATRKRLLVFHCGYS